MQADRKRSNNSGLLLGSYKAIVVDNAHPKKWHMAKVKLIGYWDEIPGKDLPWAEYLLPLGCRPNEGDALPVQIGDIVWVDFPQSGESVYPRITGSAYQVPEDSYLPKDLFEKVYADKRTAAQPEAPSVQYGDRVVDLFGLLEQLTMNGDWCVTHKSSGTAIHIDKDGNLVLHTEGDSFRSSTGNTTEEIDGAFNIIVKGDLNAVVDGMSTIESKGGAKLIAETEIDGNVTITKNLTVNQNISAPSGNVSDQKSSMQSIRNTYNSHDHNHGTPKTSPPISKM